MALLATFVDWNEGSFLDLVGNLTFFAGIFGGTWLAGRAIRRRRGRERDLILEREAKARAAVLEERTRIARELHDVVAHAISVIVLQSRGARHALDADTDEARGAIDAIERTASQALAEMRRLLAILRAEDDATLAPQPSLAHLDTLAAGAPLRGAARRQSHRRDPQAVVRRPRRAGWPALPLPRDGDRAAGPPLAALAPRAGPRPRGTSERDDQEPQPALVAQGARPAAGASSKRPQMAPGGAAPPPRSRGQRASEIAPSRGVPRRRAGQGRGAERADQRPARRLIRSRRDSGGSE
jgi:hypothetical protein